MYFFILDVGFASSSLRSPKTCNDYLLYLKTKDLKILSKCKKVLALTFSEREGFQQFCFRRRARSTEVLLFNKPCDKHIDYKNAINFCLLHWIGPKHDQPSNKFCEPSFRSYDQKSPFSQRKIKNK